MSFVEAIARKRDGASLHRQDVRAFVEGATRNDLPVEQLAAMLMAMGPLLEGISEIEVPDAKIKIHQENFFSLFRKQHTKVC